MVEITIELPDDEVGRLFPWLARTTAVERPPWDVPLARQFLGVDQLREEEKSLLRRMAEARGRRVPLSALARDLGLPAAPAIEQDFPRLAKFCAEETDPPRPDMPVVAGGEEDRTWYWMPPDAAQAFRRAFAQPAGE